MKISKVDSLDELEDLKQQFVQRATAPLDGMWLNGFVPMAQHYSLEVGGKRVGYYCINEQHYLLQFLIDTRSLNLSADFFRMSIETGCEGKQAIGAFVSTAEPHYLSLCLDHFSHFEVNALMYERNHAVANSAASEALSLTPLLMGQLAVAVEFAVLNIGAPSEWVGGYYRNLIARGEIFGVWENEALVAIGENRGFDQYQTDCADLGVVVAKTHRDKGFATRILSQMAKENDARGLLSICSTEASNLAAQKAITRSGFAASNRIVRFDR